MTKPIEIDGKKYEELTALECLHQGGRTYVIHLPGDRHLREIKPEPMPEILPGYLVKSANHFILALDDGWRAVRSVDGNWIYYWWGAIPQRIEVDCITAIKDREGKLIWEKQP